MEADWEFEVGPDRRALPRRSSKQTGRGLLICDSIRELIEEIQEATAFPPLAALLVALNGTHSPAAGP